AVSRGYLARDNDEEKFALGIAMSPSRDVWSVRWDMKR
ncbi:hypothetical protein A2U01_0066198, partial [Trifolium medium]|nr:hypothetical protein [Trifolium medium]